MASILVLTCYVFSVILNLANISTIAGHYTLRPCGYFHIVALFSAFNIVYFTLETLRQACFFLKESGQLLGKRSKFQSNFFFILDKNAFKNDCISTSQECNWIELFLSKNLIKCCRFGIWTFSVDLLPETTRDMIEVHLPALKEISVALIGLQILLLCVLTLEHRLDMSRHFYFKPKGTNSFSWKVLSHWNFPSNQHCFPIF